MNAPIPEQGALERLGIPVETTPPEGILTAGTAQSIRFRISEPAGYAYPDVESFMFEYLIPTLEWYSKALHQRDLAVHKLGEELDRSEVSNLNLRAQLENKDFNDALGIAVEESQTDDEYVTLLAEYNNLVAEREQYQQAYNTLLEEKAQLEQSLAQAGSEPASTEGMYSHAEVEGFIAQAVAEAEKNAGTPGAVYTEEEFQSALTAQLASTQAAYANMYSEEQVQQMLQENEAAVRASIPKTAPKDAEDEIIEEVLDDEGSLGLRAKVRTLEDSLDQMDTYTRELEKYVAELEGKVLPEEDTRPLDSYGRPLPEIRPEDL